MKEQNKVRISQCMIVKNEEANMERALTWGREIMWEQIVVDTGSTDRTVEIATSMGATVYHIPWDNDFAAAKNYAIGKAKGDWIAFLDADEEFAPGDEKKLAHLLNHNRNTNADGIATAWMQLDDKDQVTVAGTQIRVFRNREGLEYRRRIHEQLGWRDGTPIRLADATKELSILHRGYSGEAWKEKKVSTRNLDLILKELEEHPDDYEMIGYLGDEYYAADRQEEAAECYRRAIMHMPDCLDERDQRSAATFLRLLQIMDGMNATSAEMTEIYDKATELLGKEADFDYIMGCYFLRRQDYISGAIHYEKALQKLETYGSNNRAMLLVGHLQEAYEKLATCALMSGAAQKAVSYSTAVLKANPYSMSALYVLIRAFRGEGVKSSVPLEDTLPFLNKIYNFDSMKDRLLLLKTAEKADHDELKRYMEDTFTAEELAYIKGKRTEGGENS